VLETVQKSNSSTINIDLAWKKYLESNDQKAKEELVLHYLPLVKYVAGRIAISLPPSVSMDDLVSEGIIGLLNALERFDPTRGVVFETYARSRVFGSIMDQLRSLDWLPRSLRQKAKRLEETYYRLENKLGRNISEEEIAEEMQIPVKDVGLLMSEVVSMSVYSLEGAVQNNDGNKNICLMDTIENKNYKDPLITMEEKQIHAFLKESIKNLPKQERLVIILYYFEKLTLKEIGTLLSLSESRISQIHSKAILKLKTRLKRLKNEYNESKSGTLVNSER
jgi:RNA polymerase sigma factor for flagellar operon FliA